MAALKGAKAKVPTGIKQYVVAAIALEVGLLCIVDDVICP